MRKTRGVAGDGGGFSRIDTSASENSQETAAALSAESVADTNGYRVAPFGRQGSKFPKSFN